MNIDEIVGCNVRGRLLEIKHLMKIGCWVEAHEELDKLLEFFPEESDCPICGRELREDEQTGEPFCVSCGLDFEDAKRIKHAVRPHPSEIRPERAGQ